ncbi:MAG TPA: GNAT family N-acetyltransferase [Pyrinomonadaceae bacterium]|nr:GNAT family N-acetyltransferase [Pyrinomonadaceae bacterium]
MIRPLTDDDFDFVYAAFLETFSDYIVRMNPTREQFAEMLRRRGYVAQASAGAFQGESLVAFTLNCIEGARGYDSGTGVVPSFRRRGLGREVMDRSSSLLRAHGCKRYVLEVLEGNSAAAALYSTSGFIETRRLQCWSFESPDCTVDVTLSSPLLDLEVRQTWWTVQPSWQNSIASIRRAHDRSIALGNDEGYAVVFPSNGDLPQLAVRPQARRQGVGTRLLHAAAAVSGKPLRIMNVDDRDNGIARFLEHTGAVRTLRQIEMEREL